MTEELEILSYLTTFAATGGIALALYALFMAFGKCPACRTRLDRRAKICVACGCRVQDYNIKRRARN
jgi:hypothetical protein